MENTIPEMSHFLNSDSISGNIESSALVAEQPQLIPQQPITYFNEDYPLNCAILFGDNFLGLGELMVDRAMTAEPGIENWCDENLGRIPNYGKGIEFGKSCPIARTASCPAMHGGKGKAVALSPATGKEINLKKRKADKPAAASEEKPLEKKVKADADMDFSVQENGNNKDTISNQKGILKENSKDTEIVKRDYIHVRARRGQATDSHSLAERVRRQKISAKMKYLQNLVPGCNKITGKAGMLEEIINYVQSLQRQVEFLSMKLASITPSLGFGIDNYLAKEMFSACGYNNAAMVVSSVGQGASSSGLEVGVNALDITLKRTISAPVYAPEPGLDSPSLNQIQHFVLDAELQNLYSMDLQQGFTGFQTSGHVKLEEM